MVSEEGKERLMPPQEQLTCTEDMMANSEEQQTGVTSISASNKRPLVELSEADSTVTNGFDAPGSLQQNDGASLPSKKQRMDTDEENADGYASSNASSTTSSPHEIVSNFLSHTIFNY